MGYVILNLVALTLILGFLALTSYEERRGVRVFAARRAALDERISRLTYVLSHIDFAAFLREESRRIAKQISHIAVAVTLRAVRALERLLTRLIVYLRTRYPVDAERSESTRPFLRTLSDFKDRLKDKTDHNRSGIE